MEKTKRRKISRRLSLLVIAILSCLIFASCAMVVGERGITPNSGELGTGSVNVGAYTDSGGTAYTISNATSSHVPVALGLVPTGTTLTTYFFNYTGGAQTFTSTSGGKYLLEVWGAQGGRGAYNNNANNSGGYGAYARGVLELKASTALNIYVGGRGNTGNGAAGGYNGGGRASVPTSRYGTPGSGGGASDIRIGGTTVNHRVIVAGGGGGNIDYSSTGNGTSFAWAGGTTTGGTGQDWCSGTSPGTGGSQTAGGSNPSGYSAGTARTNGYIGEWGVFGQGGAGEASRGYPGAGGGGGGGWYGGGAGNNCCGGSGGGGGSSWVLTSSAQGRPSGFAHTGASPYNLSNTTLSAGNQSCYQPNTTLLTTTQTGNGVQSATSNHGYIRITLLVNPVQQSSVNTFSTVRDTALSAWTITNKTNLYSTLGVQDNNPDTVTSGFRFVTGGVYTEASIANNAAAAGWITVNQLTATTLQVTPRVIMTNKPFYVLTEVILSNGSAGPQRWVQFNLTSTRSVWSKKTTNDDIMRIGVSDSSAEPAGGIGASPDAWGNYTPNPTKGRTTIWMKKPLTPNNSLVLKAGDVFTNPHPALDDVVYSPESTNAPYKDDTIYALTASAGDRVIAGYNGTYTLSIAEGVQSKGKFHYVTLYIQNREIRSTTGTGAITNQQFGVTEVVDIVFRIENTRTRALDAAHYMLSTASATRVALNTFAYDPDGDGFTIAEVKVPTGEYLPMNKYSTVTAMGKDAAQTDRLNNQYNFGALSNSDTGSTRATGEGSALTGFKSNFITSPTSTPHKDAYLSYEVIENGAAISFRGLKPTRNRYATPLAGDGTSRRLGHFYVMVRVVDQGEPADAGVWIPVALSVGDNAPVERSNRPYADLERGGSKIFSPLGIGTDSMDFQVMANHGGTVPSPTIVYDPLVQDSDFGLTPYFIDNDIAGYPNSSANRNTQAFEDLLFIDPAANASLESGTCSYTANGNAVTTNFSKFFSVRFVTLRLPLAVTGRMSAEEMAYAQNNNLFQVRGAGAERYIEFLGLEVIAKYGTPYNTILEFNVVLRSVKEGLRGLQTEYAVGTTVVNSRVAVTVANSGPTAVSDFEFDSLAGNISQGERAWHKNTSSNTFDYYLPKSVAGQDTVKITPYDIAKDLDIFAFSAGGGNINQKLNSNPRHNGYVDAVGAVTAKQKLTTAATIATTGATVQRTDIMNDGLRFAGQPHTVTGAEYTDLSLASAGESVEKFDELTITALKKSGTATGTEFSIDVRDESRSTTNSTVTIRIRVFVLNTAPVLKSTLNPSTQYFTLQVAADVSSNSIEGTGEQPGSGTNMNTVFKPNASSPTPTAYNTREYFVRELVTDIDEEDIAGLYFSGAANGIAVGTLKSFTLNPKAADFVAFTHMGEHANPAMDNPFVSASLQNGTGTRSGSTGQVLRITAKSSTQGFVYGVWVMFTVSDGTNTAVFFIQIEVLNSSAKMNTEAFALQAEGADPQALPSGYYLNIQASDDDESSTKFLVSDQRMITEQVPVMVGGASERLSTANARVLGTDSDGVQRLVPIANNSSQRIWLPQVPEFYYTNRAEFNTAGTYKNSRDFMKVYVDVPIAQHLTLAPYGSNSIRDYFKLVWFDNAGNEVVPATLEDSRNLMWAIVVKFEVQHIFNQNAISIILCVTDSNQDVEIGDLTGNRAGGFGALYNGKRPQEAPVVSAVNASFEFGLHILKDAKAIVNNFEENGLTTAFAGKHAVTGNIEIGGGYQKQTFYSSVTNQVQFDSIDIPGGGSKVYVPYTYFATPYSSSLNPTTAPSAIGLATTHYRDIMPNTSMEDAALGSLSIKDDKNTWSGTNFRNNPYIKVSFTKSTAAGTFKDSTKKYSMTGRYVRVANTTGGEYGGTRPDLVVTRQPDGADYEDNVTGLVIEKSYVRSESLEFTISLMAWGRSGQDFNQPGTQISVTVPVNVDNDKMNVTGGIQGVNNYLNMPTTKIETSLGANSQRSVGILSDADGDRNLEGLSYNGPFYFNNDGFDTVNTVSGGSKFPDITDKLKYREKALFAVKSIDYSFNDTERARLMNGGSPINTNNGGSIEGYFGGAGSFTANQADPDYEPNPHFRDFFEIDLLTDSASFRVTPKAKTFLNFEQAGSTKEAWMAEYNLKDDGDGKIYYPLRLLAYDDYNGSGWTEASYVGVCIKIYILNSAPTISASFITDPSQTKTVNDKADNTGTNQSVAVPVHTRRVDAAISGTNTTSINIASIVTEQNMKINPMTGYFMNKDQVLATDASALSDFEKLTTDYMKNIRITPVNNGNESITMTLDSAGNNLVLSVAQRPAGVSVTDESKPAKEFIVSFFDSQDNRNTSNASSADMIKNATVLIRIMYRNTPPRIQTGASEAVGTSTADNHITMRTGASFRLVTTDFVSFNSYGVNAQVSANFTNRTNPTTKNHADDSSPMAGTNGWWNPASANFDTSPDEFKNGRGSRASTATGFIGNLAVAMDDTPWALRFDKDKIRVNDSTQSSSLLTIRKDFDLMKSEDPDHTVGGVTAEYPLTLLFTAAGSTSSPLKIDVPIFDESSGSRVTFTFYVTIISTAPIAKDGSRVPARNNFDTTDLERSKEFADESRNVFVTNVSIGETKSYLLTDFVYDVDSGDEGKLTLSDENGRFLIDGVSGNENRYMRMGYELSGGAKITVTCLDFHTNTSNEGKLYNEITFKVNDPGGQGTVTIILRVKTWRNSLETEAKATNSTGTTMTVEANAVTVSTDTTIQLVTNTAKTGTASVLANDPVVIDKDYNGGRSQARYSFRVYSLLNITDGKGTIGENIKPTGESWDDAKADRLLFSFIQQPLTPGSSTNPPAVLTVSTDDTTPAITEFWNYVAKERIIPTRFAGDGSSFTITALMRTPTIEGKSIPEMRPFPMYIEIFKPDDRDLDNRPGGSSAFVENAAFKLDLTIKNSRPTAFKDGDPWFYGTSDNFLDFRGTRGDIRTYQVYDPFDSNSNTVLFKDADNNSELDDVQKSDVQKDRITVATPETMNGTKSFVADYSVVAMYKYDPVAAAQGGNPNKRNLDIGKVGGSIAVSVVRPVYESAEAATAAGYRNYFNEGKFVAEYLNIEIRHKPILGGDDQGFKHLPTAIEIAVKAKDTMLNKETNNGASTEVYNIIRIIIENSPARLTDKSKLSEDFTYPSNMKFSENYLGEPELEIAVEKGKPAELRITDILDNKDFVPNSPVNSDTITFVSETGEGSQDQYFYSAINTQITGTNPTMPIAPGISPMNANLGNSLFTAQVKTVSNSVANSVIVFNALTNDRGAEVDTFLKIQTSSSLTTNTLKIRLVTANTAPKALSSVAQQLYVQGYQGGKGSVGGDDDGDITVDGREADTRNILSMVTDSDITDNVDASISSSSTFLRVVNYDKDDIICSDPIAQVKTNGKQLLYINPNQEQYGSFSFYLFISDGPGYENFWNRILELEKKMAANTISERKDHPNQLSEKEELDMYRAKNSEVTTDAKWTIVRVIVTVVANPDEMPVNDIKIPYRSQRALTPNMIFDTINAETGETVKDNGSGFVIHDVKPHEDNSNKDAITIYKNGVLENGKSPVSASLDRTADTTAGNIRWEIIPMEWQSNVVTVNKLYVTVGVKGDTKRTVKTISVQTEENKEPVQKAEYIGKRTFYASDLTDKMKHIAPEDVVTDLEGDKLTFVEATSQKSVVIRADIDSQANTLVLKFNGNGESLITVKIRDAVSEYNYEFTAKNTDLPSLNIFMLVISFIQANMLMFWIMLGVVIFLILLLIIIIASARKKKRIRAEIEALLVSEMELEEQMLRLAASPAPTYYQSYGYLSPTQNIQQNPQFMLGGGGTQQPPMNQGMMLNAGQGQHTQHPSYNSIPEFDDDDL